MSYYWFNKPELLQKAQDKYRNCEGKKNAAKHYIANKEAFFFKKTKKQTISIEACQKKKKKQKENMEEIGIKI